MVVGIGEHGVTAYLDDAVIYVGRDDNLGERGISTTATSTATHRKVSGSDFLVSLVAEGNVYGSLIIIRLHIYRLQCRCFQLVEPCHDSLVLNRIGRFLIEGFIYLDFRDVDIHVAVDVRILLFSVQGDGLHRTTTAEVFPACGCIPSAYVSTDKLLCNPFTLRFLVGDTQSLAAVLFRHGCDGSSERIVTAGERNLRSHIVGVATLVTCHIRDMVIELLADCPDFGVLLIEGIGDSGSCICSSLGCGVCCGGGCGSLLRSFVHGSQRIVGSLRSFVCLLGCLIGDTYRLLGLFELRINILREDLHRYNHLLSRSIAVVVEGRNRGDVFERLNPLALVHILRMILQILEEMRSKLRAQGRPSRTLEGFFNITFFVAHNYDDL